MTHQPTPAVGRIVHYVSYGTPGGEYTSQCRAAIITAVHGQFLVDIAVLNPEGMFFNRGVTHGEPKPDGSHEGGSWHWAGACVMAGSAEEIARSFHEAYEELAPSHGYETREASRKPWSDVPEQNRALMIAVVGRLLDEGVIS
ncbi:hypothetical protein OG393_20930 [Streptomyces sp. NBC_01216]|uniref:hypothetical protein n=1 Tax=Streptomyces sp. NBC_01216 TaxID=2903778 RepID=UPI002E0DFBC0|nr:hypothetical protein OG393_20930 [Streptomyces sp. NBC_01216]